MSPELKQKWLDALRSGKYQHTKGVLNRTLPVFSDDPTWVGCNTGYCCLGVLCEVMELRKESLATDCRAKYFYYDDEMTHNLEPEFMDHVGLTYSQRDNLIQINDTSTSFDNVIKYIEEKI